MTKDEQVSSKKSMARTDGGREPNSMMCQRRKYTTAGQLLHHAALLSDLSSLGQQPPRGDWHVEVSDPAKKSRSKN
jgi:hypothetical protein